MILQQAEGFKCQPTVAPHQLFATHLPLNTNQRRGSHTHTHAHTHTYGTLRHTLQKTALKKLQGSVAVLKNTVQYGAF